MTRQCSFNQIKGFFFCSSSKSISFKTTIKSAARSVDFLSWAWLTRQVQNIQIHHRLCRKEHALAPLCKKEQSTCYIPFNGPVWQEKKKRAHMRTSETLISRGPHTIHSKGNWGLQYLFISYQHHFFFLKNDLLQPNLEKHWKRWYQSFSCQKKQDQITIIVPTYLLQLETQTHKN